MYVGVNREVVDDDFLKEIVILTYSGPWLLYEGFDYIYLSIRLHLSQSSFSKHQLQVPN